MKEQDVKIGMKVKLSSFGFANYLIKICESKNLIPIFVVLERINDTLFDKYRIETRKGEDFLSFELDCSFFEPYEETKEEGVDAFKAYLDEKDNENYKSPKEIQEYFDNYCKKETEGISDLPTESARGFFIPAENHPPFSGKAVFIGEYHLPITQEFIESFGFEQSLAEVPKGILFVKMLEDKSIHLCVNREWSLYSLYCTNRISGEGGHFNKSEWEDAALFSDFACTTQSELRFLLTKGRIDCSK